MIFLILAKDMDLNFSTFKLTPIELNHKIRKSISFWKVKQLVIDLITLNIFKSSENIMNLESGITNNQ